MNNESGRKRSQKHEQILESAENLFLKQGYVRTSMDAVAEEAQVSKQTVYAYYSSKEALFTAVVSGKCPAGDFATELLQQDATCRDTLTTLGQYTVKLLLSEENIRVVRLCIGSAEEHPELSRLLFTNGPERYIEALAHYLTEQTAKGNLRVDHPRMAASQLLMAFRGEAGLRLDLNVPLDPDEDYTGIYIERTVDLFLAYYGT